MQMKKLKEERGSMAVYVTIVLFSFLLVLSSIYLSSTSVRKSQLMTVIKVKESYETNIKDIEQIYQEQYNKKRKGPNGKPLVTTLTEKQESTVIAEDRLGNRVVVPGGFKVVAGETVQDGIVIEDDNITTYEDGTTSTGNQFVWVPVSNIDNSGSNKIKIENADKTVSEVEITLGRYAFAGNNASVPGKSILVQSGADYSATTLSTVEEGSVTNYMIGNNFYELKDFREADQSSSSSKINATAKDLEEFIESVYISKGYYLARYEASYESGDTFGVGIAPEGKEYYKPASKVSKANSKSSMNYTAGTLWNFITEGNASMASRQMYYGNNFLESDLCNSYAWDTAIVYIQAMGNSNYANANTNNTLKNTGETGDEKCHIYDMAGNVRECTTEYTPVVVDNIAYSCVCRGGVYGNKSRLASGRNGKKENYKGEGYISFRTILYGKLKN